MIAAVSFDWLRNKAMAAWLCWFGFVCALALLAAVIFIPMVALPLWAIVVGVVLLTRSAETPTAAATALP
jgi:hypothetical protein